MLKEIKEKKEIKEIKEIKENTTLAEVLAIKGAEEVLAKYKVPCLTCPFAKMEMDQLTLGQICQMYSLDCVKLIEELNKK